MIILLLLVTMITYWIKTQSLTLLSSSLEFITFFLKRKYYKNLNLLINPFFTSDQYLLKRY